MDRIFKMMILHFGENIGNGLLYVVHRSIDCKNFLEDGKII